MKRIISTALTVIMLLTSIIAVIPMNAFAAGSNASDAIPESTLTVDEIAAYVNKVYLGTSYNTPEEMLEIISTEYPGYLISSSSADGKYTIHIDRYSGFVFYVNNITGQIMTSNPIDVSGFEDSTRQTLMSQISIHYVEVANSKALDEDFNSAKWAALYSQISIDRIAGGLRVNYILGDTSTRFLLPGMISARDFHDHIITPILNSFNKTYKEALASVGIDDAAADELLKQKYFELLGEEYTEGKVIDLYYKYNYAPGLAGTVSEDILDSAKLGMYINAAQAVADEKAPLYKSAVKTIHDIVENMVVLGVNGYTLKDINSDINYDNGVVIQELVDETLKKYPVCRNMPVYVFREETFTNNQLANFRQFSGYIKNYCPDYTFDMMYEDEAECGFHYDAVQKPVFHCALEYTFNSDGSLSVSLPSNSIIFDETVYNLMSITPLQYFGCGDMSKEGYLFYPDGSGSILDFSDFYTSEHKVAVNVKSKVYGQDYCYSNVEGKHREQITMPVFGIVSTTSANKTTTDRFGLSEIKSGYFVMLEEGNSLASLGFISSTKHRYISAYASYTPYPADQYELSETITVGSVSEMNTMVGKIKYDGSYVSRIVMLTDDRIGQPLYGTGNYYPASYTGMATYYRNILKANGTLTALEKLENDIPLYIETLGAMTITDKFLTFPVEKSIPLTTFDNVITMYEQLSNAKEYVDERCKYYADLEKQADEDKNELLAIEYRAKKEKFEELKTQVEDINNINFRLTGYANGGMNFTYPTKLKWEKCCGGKSGFEDLVNFTLTESKGENNFEIFPDFDFLYINNTARFDGISNKGNVSRMIDNRYASKQVYNSVLGEYESFFAMVISTDTLSKHFGKFNKKYSEFGLANISVSTLGSNLNSNFNEKNTVNREASRKNTIALLEEMVYQNGYSVMMDTGNIYAAKYATHILNVPTDFSSFRFSSYAIPFVGMILHGYANYAGSPLNYSGSPDYEILRAIECGANPYFIVCFQNTAFMKDDEVLNKYYGIDYENWYDEILLSYKRINAAIGDLQDYEIVDHVTVLAERAPDESEKLNNYTALKNELFALFTAQLSAAVDAAVDANGSSVKVEVDVDSLYNQFANSILAKYKSEIEKDLTEDGKSALKEAIREISVNYANEYPGNAAPALLKFSEVKNAATGEAYTDYTEYSKYSFTTESNLYENKTYERTDYTLDTDNVVMVTYKKGDKVVKFVLNYNLFDVVIRTDANSEPVTIESYGFHTIKSN